MKMIHVQLPGDTCALCLPEVLAPKGRAISAGPDIISHLPGLSAPSPSHVSDFSPELYQTIQHVCMGKELLYEELPWDWRDLEPFLLARILVLRPGLTPTKKGWVCRRCGNASPRRYGELDCARCGTKCFYCRHCVNMGRVSACSALIAWNGPTLFSGSPQPLLQWNGAFSAGQKRAAASIVEAVEMKSERLVWAVCGAGKTEVLFPGLERSLQKGERILLAAPRTDVVLELLPRLQKVFPDTAIAGLYGGSEEKDCPAQLVIATTHQTMRFADAFDLVIIDEVDAFPFTADASLVNAVEKAARSVSARIHLTATPTPFLQKQVKKKLLPCVRIPRRYHGFPLPVPRMEWSGAWKRPVTKGRLPKKVLRWCRTRMEETIPAFVFVPSVTVLEEVTAILQKTWPAVEGVHSADDQRHDKVQRFREGTVPLLVTTTILERGVTIPGVEAAVLGAESTVFTESALVQIAGRVGRSSEDPDGGIVFFHAGKTEAMTAAVRHILMMNKEQLPEEASNE
ncbi:DEAD/DEAH box helicase [Salibacterium aidingense]|uniref:DEAD/DEAH box helicase n=1 Tax=Salibacterium aidingense TaxID=384933 RepID=UPI003BDB8E00